MDISITGYGAVSPFGHGVEALWDALVAGRSGVRVLERAGARWEQVPVMVGAAADLDADGALGRVRANRLDRSQQLALVAADEAWADAGSPEVEGDRLARRRRHGHRGSGDPARRPRRARGRRSPPGLPAFRPDAHGERRRSADQHRPRCPRRRVHHGLGLCLRRGGDRDGCTAHRDGGGRRRDRRRDGGGRHPGHDGVVRAVPGTREAGRRRPDDALTAVRRLPRGFVLGEGAGFVVPRTSVARRGPGSSSARHARRGGGSPRTPSTSPHRSRTAASRNGRCGPRSGWPGSPARTSTT